jgi:hypothetical protein
MIIRFDIGDFSQDGHNVVDPILVECSHSSDEIAAAYWKTVESTGFKLHDRVYNHNEDRELHNIDYKNLVALSFEFPKDFDAEDGSPEDIMKMFIHMVKIGNPSINMQIIKEDETFFICGNSKRNFGLGYGLFNGE